MTEHRPRSKPQLFMTAPAPCPYLPGRMERKVFTLLAGRNADAIHNTLTNIGFRRSQSIAYRPACSGCSACVSVRVRAREFTPSRSFKRVIKRNGDLTARLEPATATEEQFSLLRSYLDSRHGDGGMADMTVLDYTAMVEETAVQTGIMEYRDPAGTLIAVALTDELTDGLSMVYSFFDPALPSRSLGTYMVLDHIARAAREGLDYVYLGYWVNDSQKMAYKTRFGPIEALCGDEQWRLLPDG